MKYMNTPTTSDVRAWNLWNGNENLVNDNGNDDNDFPLVRLISNYAILSLNPNQFQTLNWSNLFKKNIYDTTYITISGGSDRLS